MNRRCATRRRGVGLTVAILGRGLGILALVLAVRATLYASLPPADLSRMTWSDAFEAMHVKLTHEYAFGAWKGIDWDMLRATYAPKSPPPKPSRMNRRIIEPLQPHYSGPVVVLIDHATFSSGEGIPMAISRLSQGTVIGFYDTYGSFGMTGGEIDLPGALTLFYPDGQSLDAEGAIQLDSDASLQGGVAPTMRVPMTEATARSLFLNREDVLLDFAVQYLNDRIGRTP